MEQVLARGVNFLYTKKFIIEKYGVEAFERVLQSLSAEAQKIWRGTIMPVQQHPFSLYKEFISALSAQSDIQKSCDLSIIYEYIADHSLNKLYKIFFSFTKPQFVIKNYPKLWQQFFNTGEVEVQVSESEHAILKFQLPDIFLDWLEPACFGYSKKAVEMSGGKNLTMKCKGSKRLSDGLCEIVYELHWS
jgi:hypothetical protein